MQSNDQPDYITVPDKGLFFVPLGGAGEIGINFGLYSCDGQWIAVDCGVGFAGDRLPGVDMVLPDPTFAEQIAKNLKALIITHAHEDHIGAVGHFWPLLRCPVYATPFATEMLETRLDEAGILGRVSLETVEAGDELDLAPFDIELIPVNHSVPEAVSLLIRTKYGNVFHTGDWRFDDTPVVGKPANYARFKELGKENVLAMVADSTNVFVESDILSENDVKDSLTTLFSRYSGKRLVVTCFASNVGRIESIAEAAEKNGRTVCLLGRSLWRVEGAGRACGYFRGINVFLTDEEAQDLPPSKVLYLCTGCQGEPKAALSNLSYGVYRSLQLNKGDVVIFSSRVIPGNEQAIANIKNRFIAKGIEVVTDKDALTHVSGHANRNDMKRMYGFVRPKIAVPVHGEAAHLFEHAKLADECGISQTVIPKDGDVISFGADKAEVIGSVQSGLMAMDGRKIIPVNADVLKKRRRMLEDGTVVATVVLDKKNAVVGSVQISATGLIDAQSPEMSVLDEGIKAALSSLTPARLKDDGSVADAVKAAIRKTVMENHGRRPMVDVHLVRV
ncbi:metallo-beta-lactamase [Acetobacter sp. CAG:977]|nr:metallo-beta-lactamase [Acetobacter sp. CAG:977]